MPEDSFKLLKERVERLRKNHLRALESFHVFEEIQEHRAPNIYGEELAKARAAAIGVYKGFFNPVQNALNTQLHISVAKLFDSHRDALHIDKLVKFAESNQTSITSLQKSELNEGNDAVEEFARTYEGLSKDELHEINVALENSNDTIERLKAVRDQEVAHINLKEPEDIEYLTYQEFADLIQLSEKILNMISRKIYGDIAWFEPYKGQVVDDTKSLLRLVDESEGIKSE